MSSHSNLFSPSPISCILPRPRLSFKSFWSLGAKDHKRPNSPLRCCPKSKAGTDQDGFQHSLPVIKWRAVVEYHTDREADHDVKERVDSIKRMLSSMNDGEISISAYDTAWVALVQDVNGSGLPQFPSTLRWIANNQLPDGSWGDDEIFLAYDRILNTLACVIALKSWNILPEKYEKGISFLNENMSKLESDNDEHMPIGFEVAFPSLLEIARRLNIEIPYDSPIFQDIYAKRNVKLERIPRDILHKLPTTLLHSLEGMPDLDWEKILKLKCQDGSFLFSPSSTAFAVMQTKDLNCLNYLKRVVRRFNGGVPCVYPVDLYEHIWTVDRLQRLGISRYFQPEIKECINYVSRYWTHKGICWARNSKVYDIDDTAMGFRLLRLHGHEVSADVFQHFEKGGEFCCFGRQSTQAVTGMFNLYRASQVLFPGEKILEDAKQFSSNFLRERQAANQLSDKWIIMKDLSGEVWYALQVPWYASLPRVETRFYLEQYGGKDDVWIGKTLYRKSNTKKNGEALLGILLEFLNHLSLESIVDQDRQEISHHLRQAWEKWLLEWYSDGDRHKGEAELLAHMINVITAGHSFSEELLSHAQYKRLSSLINRVCYKLSSYQKDKVDNKCSHNITSYSNYCLTTPEIESEMQEVVQLVLHNSKDDIHSDIKQTFLAIAKSFYYAAYCDHGTINFHIAKVLFDRVV
ncbi:(-)-kolavenyl diphosphate synthase TPS28, chloroplastic-like isoform X5 [Carya illinoinensis]|uniref:(-)-kolavenyl diphosphate synthase TPS28, chloroplastic-like isoform X5 n=1 Tax=Carya illinoinensis TaxID=32201 RepID=UPI001C71DC80|nr:(-)-kolavenyl diphosphate synthase TPS28, chloroplastic-like isoform X5 [Carya illinoinensis]